MGYNDQNAAKIVFDVETAPLADAVDYLEAAEAPAHYKDPLKIAAYVEQANADALDKCGLDVDLCRLVAIGTRREDEDTPCVWLAADDAGERDMLQRFWQLTADRHLVGFNCLGFDLPVLLRRSLYLGVPTPHLQIDRFKHPQVTDLMDELSFGGKLKFRGLSFFCRRFGIDVPDPLTGAGIAAAVAEGRWTDVDAHVSADVQKTAQLAARLGAFHLTPEAVF
jgi:hypothetical protein